MRLMRSIGSDFDLEENAFPFIVVDSNTCVGYNAAKTLQTPVPPIPSSIAKDATTTLNEQ